MGFRGSRKSTPFAAQTAAKRARATMEHDLKTVEVLSRGGSGEAAIRAQTAGLEVTMIKDVTPIPHSGAVRLETSCLMNGRFYKQYGKIY